MLLKYVRYNLYLPARVSDPHPFHANPDSGVKIDVDPVPGFPDVNPDLDPGCEKVADLDPKLDFPKINVFSS